MGHADFGVGGKIFASLPDLDEDLEDLGMVKLTPEQQARVLEEEPAVFTSCQGAWGARGATYVRLKRARVGSMRRVLELAWRNTAPARVVAPKKPPARPRRKRA